MSGVGVVFVRVGSGDSAEAVRRALTDAMASVPSGRCLVVTWVEKPSPAGTRMPVEALSVEHVLGAAEHRSGDPAWHFFGNGAARLYSGKHFGRPYATCLWVAFRKAGEKAYVRRHQVTDSVATQSRVAVTSPVFTRDVANNVWHLRDNEKADRVIGRLQCLFSWSDEFALIFGESGPKRRRFKGSDYGEDLVGVPTKTVYSWGGLSLFDS